MTFNEWNAAQQKECGVMPIGIQAPTGSGVKAMQAQVNRIAENLIADYRALINNVNNTLTQKDVEFRETINTIIERLNNASSGTTKEQIREAIIEILSDATFKLPELSLALCGGKYKLTDALGAMVNSNYVKSYEFAQAPNDTPGALPSYLNITMATGETYTFNSGPEHQVQLTDENNLPSNAYLIGYEAENFPYGRGGIYLRYDREALVFEALGANKSVQNFWWDFRGGSPYLYVSPLSNVSPITELTDGTVQVTFNSNTTTTTTETTNGGSGTTETTNSSSNTSDTNSGSSTTETTNESTTTETSGGSGVSEGL